MATRPKSAPKSASRPSRVGKRPLSTFQTPDRALVVRRLCIELGVAQDDFVAYAVNCLLVKLGRKPALEVPEARERILEAYRTGALKLPD